MRPLPEIDTPRGVRRREWKYRVSPDVAAELMEALGPHTGPDPYCVPGLDGAYPVQSLYYDTPDLRFYHERKDGVKVRRKLRVRHYGDEVCFLEIKRKVDKKVLKERVAFHRSEVAVALNGTDSQTLMTGRTEDERRTLERFRFNLRSLGLIPTALIAYRRHALVGRLTPRLRITVDSNLRCQASPGPEALFEDAELPPFEERCVLELKFDGRAPHWLMRLISGFQLRRESYSKYCEGIDGTAGAAALAAVGRNGGSAS